jgi:two-component system, OmpR family, response regulator
MSALLYVEDEALIREIFAMALEDAGFEVVSAGSAAAALEALEDNSDPFCAVLTDVNLGPGPTGWDVAKRARELNETLPVIYVTGEDAREWGTKGVPNSRIVRKPFTTTQVVEAVAALIPGEK